MRNEPGWLRVGGVVDYRGRCHCGRVRFSFRSAEITTAIRCDCSLCVRRGAVLSPTYIPAADFVPHDAPDDVGVYAWNDRVLDNVFCKTCGIFTYVVYPDGGTYRVNLGCVEGIDVFTLEIARVDGRSLPLAEG